MPGRDGRDGVKGEKGEPCISGTQNSGSVVYTRWGKVSCPNTAGTSLVYSGRVAGSLWSSPGGGANYLCLPEDPDYTKFNPGVQRDSLVYGTEYQTQTGQTALPGVLDYDAPCAVCHTQREVVLMVPGKTQCPDSWRAEYTGYLMSTRESGHYCTMYICLDKDPDKIPGTSANTNGAVLYHVEADCKRGLPCPPYDPQKELTCAVCTL